MAKTVEHTQASDGHGNASDMPPFLSPDVTLMLLTWVTFFALLAVLYKYAWKPILDGLETREQLIKKSLDDADQIQKKMDQVEQKCSQIISDAESRADEIVERSKKVAKDAAQIIEHKAKEEAKISLENALREIREESQKAQTKLKVESAQIAVELAGKIIEENMTVEKNRKLINRFIKDI